VCRVGSGRVVVGVLVQWASGESVGEAEEGLLLYKLLWGFAEGSLCLSVSLSLWNQSAWRFDRSLSR
jgi:hypothetical protein